VRKEVTEHVRAVTGDFVERARKHGFETVVGTSGTILTLGVLAADLRTDGASEEMINGRSVPLQALAATAERLADMTARERARLPGVDERRADTIAVGAVAIVDLVERLQADRIVLCDRALREGILADYLERNREQLGRLESHPGLRSRSVVELALRYGYDARHATQIARFATQLFDRTKSLHGLKKEYRPYLEYAAVLHDVGTHISFTGHHRHGYYLVRNGGLRGFRPEEVELIAGLVLYHRKGGPKKDDPCMQALPRKKDRRALKTLAGILRVADGLDRSHFQVVRDLNVRVAGKVVSIYIDAGEDPELEVWAAHRKGRLFERALGAELRFVLKDRRPHDSARRRVAERDEALREKPRAGVRGA
jgi:exopolyphosphatase/guanosine-5'-triphosphate,3'-diphosphate pyrophosphatase